MHQSEFPAYAGGDEVRYPVEPSSLGGAVLEIGSGAGEQIIPLIERAEGVAFTLLEPDDAPRTALAWRLRDRGLLGERTSILPITLQDSPVLTYDTILAHHVLCQISHADVLPFWKNVACRLAKGARFVTDSHWGLGNLRKIDRFNSAEAQAGRYHVYRWFSRAVVGGRAVTTNEYELMDSLGNLVHATRSANWTELADPELHEAAMRESALEIQSAMDGWFTIRRVDDGEQNA